MRKTKKYDGLLLQRTPGNEIQDRGTSWKAFASGTSGSFKITGPKKWKGRV